MIISWFQPHVTKSVNRMRRAARWRANDWQIPDVDENYPAISRPVSRSNGPSTPRTDGHLLRDLWPRGGHARSPARNRIAGGRRRRLPRVGCSAARMKFSAIIIQRIQIVSELNNCIDQFRVQRFCNLCVHAARNTMEYYWNYIYFISHKTQHTETQTHVHKKHTNREKYYAIPCCVGVHFIPLLNLPRMLILCCLHQRFYLLSWRSSLWFIKPTNYLSRFNHRVGQKSKPLRLTLSLKRLNSFAWFLVHFNVVLF